MNRPITLFSPMLSDAAIDAAAQALRSGWHGTGQRTADFEGAFAAYCDAGQCVGTLTGTDALILALTVAGVDGGEVITTPMTYVATAHAIVRAGGTPVFADIDPATGNLDPVSVADRVTERTRALAVVHYAGLPADLDELRVVARANRLRLVEDCAHAAGALYRGHRVGARTGDLHAFSFQATKNLSAAGGGAVLLSDAVEAAEVRRRRSQGVDRDSFERSTAGASMSDYSVTEIGLSAGMSDVNASIALAQLGLLDAENARRAAIAARYRERLCHVAGIKLLESPKDRTSSHYMFVVLADARDALIAKLAIEGVQAGVHYRRVDSHPVYEVADLPSAECFSRRCVTLPLHLRLDDDDVDQICDLVAGGW
jgi:perosamine synthetase